MDAELTKGLLKNLLPEATIHGRKVQVSDCVQGAISLSTTAWVEKSAVAALVAGFTIGGLRMDALDAEIKDLEVLDSFRQIDPLVVCWKFNCCKRWVLCIGSPRLLCGVAQCVNGAY